MSWQEHTLSLCRRLGPAAGFAARLVLDAVLPGSPAVGELVGQALDCACETSTDHWELNRDQAPAGTRADLDRLDEVTGLLSGPLAVLLAQVAALQSMP